MLCRNRSIVSVLESLESRRLFAAGDVDPAFGTDGFVTQHLDHGEVFINDVEVISGNRFLIAGGIPIAAHHMDNFGSYLLQQFNNDGTLDTSFGDGGTVTGNFLLPSQIQTAALTPDGKIAAIVYENSSGGKRGEYHLLARFNSDGSVDTTFGNGSGFVQITHDLRDNQGNYALAVQSDGKMLVGWENAVRRYNTDGTVDSTFRTNGEVDHIFAKQELSLALAVLSSGKILVGGTSMPELTNSGDPTALLAELNSDGSINTSFATNGIATLNFVPNQPQVYEDIRSIAEAPGGTILVGGNAGGFAAARFDANGQLDATFGTAGITIVPSQGFVERLLQDSQNRIYLINGTGGETRLTSTGAFDPSFGRVIVDLSSPQGIVSNGAAAGILSDGRLIVAGQALNVRLDGRIVVIALLTEDDGKPSPVTLTGRTLAVAGTSGDDTLKITEGSGSISATVNGIGREFDTSQIDTITADAGDGNDRIDASEVVSLPVSATGGNGIDRINGGAKNDTLLGNGGRDFIDGGLGADLISGGGGNDQIRGQGGADHLYGGPGNDYLEGDGGNDQLTGGAGTDVMHGNAGNDTFFAADGAVDSLFGDGGADTATVDNDDMLTSIETTH